MVDYLKLLKQLISFVLIRQRSQANISQSSVRFLQFLIFFFDNVLHFIDRLVGLGGVDGLVVIYDAQHLATRRARCRWILARAAFAKSRTK